MRLRLRLRQHVGPAAAVAFVLAGAACSESTNPRRGGLPQEGVVLLEDFSARQVFPPTNWWNLDVSSAPVDPQSRAIIDWISGRTAQNPTATRRVHQIGRGSWRERV